MKFDSQGWLDDAIQIDYSAKSMSRQGNKITHTCLHGTAGGTSAQGIANYFATSDVQASAHFIIDQQGVIAQGISVLMAAWGNGIITAGHASFIREDINPNMYTVSIEHCKIHDDNSDALTPIQAQKSFELNACLCDTYGIPKRAGDINGGIISHADIDPINRARCPGPYPWNDLFDYLNNGETIMIDLSNPTVASHFVAAPNGAWHCPSTNATIGGEILKFYQNFGNGLNGMSWLGLPLTSEIGGIPGKAGTVFQRFERGVLAYDPSRVIDGPPGAQGPVYLMHIDSGIGQDPRVTDLQGQVAALRSQLAALQPDALAQENTALQAKIVQAVKDLS